MYFLSPLLGIACLWDYSTGKIPNFLQFNIMSIGLLYSYYRSGWSSVLNFLIKVMVVGIIFLPLFMIKTIGAGDVKTLALAAGFFKVPQILWFVFYVMLSAVIFSLIIQYFNQLYQQISKSKFCIRSLADAILSMFRYYVKRFKLFIDYINNYKNTKQLTPYHLEYSERRNASIVMSGPMLISVILALGGVY